MMSRAQEENLVQALAQVSRVGGFTLKKSARSDDAEKVTLTLTFTGISSGFVQETLPYETEDASYQVNGRGEVMDLKVSDLDPSDLTETDETWKDVAAAALSAEASTDPDESTGAEGAEAIIEEGESPQLSEPEEAAPRPHLVGELAAAARKRR